MNEIQKYIAANEPQIMEDLFSLIRIPSISALPEHHDDMLACAERWAQLLLEAGVDEALVMPSQGNPIVFAQNIVDPDAKTVLVYAHYDVMPAEPLELWKSQPFEPEIRDGYIWARGADDDKGQSFIQVKAFEYLLKNGLLRNNVKFIFEGEEEIGSPSLEAFCEEHKELLKADVILVSDTSMLGADLPSLTTGLRGLAYWEIEVTGPNRDLHSGHFGGAVANPINVLCRIISKVTDTEHWNAIAAVRLLMYAAFGAGIREKVQRPCSLQRLMPKYLADWFRIRIIIRFRKCSLITFSVLLQKQFK